MQDSIFSKIIKGEIPCHKIYEDERTFAFLDIHPIQPGHILVVPKVQVADFYDLPDDDYEAFFQTVRRIAKHLKAHFPEKKRIGVMLEGLDVDHVHAKIFPIDTGDEYRHEPDMTAEPDHEALAAMAKKLAIIEPTKT
jgi:histidine triad (HIT) family protein